MKTFNVPQSARVFLLVATCTVFAAYILPATIGAFALLSWSAYDVTTWLWELRAALGVLWTVAVYWSAYVAWGTDA